MSAKRSSKSGVIQAAGGLLWRDSRKEKQLAIIYRSRYDDWCLPKGWREKGESFLQTAIREVMEETNCPVELGEFAGCSCYTVKGMPKIVLYWHMFLDGDCEFEPDSEVDKLVWLPIRDALDRLSYEGEKELVTKAVEE